MTSFLLNLILAVQMLSAVAMIVLILIQHGKGADMGAAFGSGSSGSLFGASGSANFLSRATAVLATVFFVATLALAYFGNLRTSNTGSSVLEGSATAAPAANAASAPANSPAAIPGSTPANLPANVPAVAASGAPTAPAPVGAGQIPSK